MRSENNDFSSFLLKIGNGQIENFEIPDKWKSTDICKKMYGSNISANDDLSNEIILSPHNEDIYKINEKILKKINSEATTYYSIDYARHKGVVLRVRVDSFVLREGLSSRLLRKYRGGE